MDTKERNNRSEETKQPVIPRQGESTIKKKKIFLDRTLVKYYHHGISSKVWKMEW